MADSSSKICVYPCACERGANGCSFPNCGQVTGTISAVAFSFIVQDPSAIIEWVSDRSRDSSNRMYRSISVSLWCELKTGCVR